MVRRYHLLPHVGGLAVLGDHPRRLQPHCGGLCHGRPPSHRIGHVRTHHGIDNTPSKPGLIQHTDRGVQYTSAAHGELLAAHQVRQSVGRPGTCWDNSVAESFFATLKTSSSTATSGLHVGRRSRPFLNSSSAGTTSTVAIPPWATPAPPKSNGAPHSLPSRP